MAFDRNQFYPLNQSCFYKLKSKKKLAKMLFTSVNALESLVHKETSYICWEAPKKKGGFRTIEAPFDNLKIIQKRIAELLQRIRPPDYLMAPVKGRSYVHNAALHVNSRAFCLLDIEEFFPSCTSKRVFWFFHKVLFCSPDVAAILTKLSTYLGHLPQGSPCSPILAYFSYVDMWDEINSIVLASGSRLSVYADDITISGKVIFERDVWAIKQTLHRHGHRFSRKKERHLIDKTAEITGVIVSGENILLPNRQHKQLITAKRSRRIEKSGKIRKKLDQQIRGRVAQAKQILNFYS